MSCPLLASVANDNLGQLTASQEGAKYICARSRFGRNRHVGCEHFHIRTMVACDTGP
jgi:hypothetical protein